MKRYTIIWVLLFVFIGLRAISQTTIIIQPDSIDGKDCMVNSMVPDDNLNHQYDFRATIWAYAGIPIRERTYFDFDFSAIPEGAIILSAGLSLYARYDDPWGQFHSNEFGANIGLIKRVTSPWNDDSITWNKQPMSTDLNQFRIPESIDEKEDYLDMDITTLVSDYIKDEESYGFVFQLENENPFRRLAFCSSDHPDYAVHPRLSITYFLCNETDTVLIFRPGRLEGKDANVDFRVPDVNQYDHYDFRASAWTFGGASLIERTFVDFNFSEIPEGSVILGAGLSLYSYYNDPWDQYHSSESGPNTCLLKRVTSYWDDKTVTWNNQPSSTSMDEVEIPQSLSLRQNNLNINVTDLVSDYIDDPSNSFGFLFQLKNEYAYRRMCFASCDHPDTTLHPKLYVCISKPLLTGITEPVNSRKMFKLYPNPAYDFINVKYNDNKPAKIQISDITGKLVYGGIIHNGTGRIDIFNLQSGIYFISVSNDSARYTEKFIKQ